MTERPKLQTLQDVVAARLVAETAVTEAQAREIVALLGTGSWTSLLREARLLSHWP